MTRSFILLNRIVIRRRGTEKRIRQKQLFSRRIHYQLLMLPSYLIPHPDCVYSLITNIYSVFDAHSSFSETGVSFEGFFFV